MEEKKDKISDSTLLEEYREAMASQRANTSIVYSWMGSIFLVLTTGLFYYGTRLDEINKIIPIMVLAVGLGLIWWGLMESFIFYIRQRMIRAHEIERVLEMKLMSGAYEEIKKMGFKAKFFEARSYVRFFIILYIVAWIVLIILNF